MTGITAEEFSKKHGFIAVTVYKNIARLGIKPLEYAKGLTKSTAVYDEDVLSKMIVKRKAGKPKDEDVLSKTIVKRKTGKPKKERNVFNVAKLW